MKRPLAIENDLITEQTATLLFWLFAAAAVVLRGIMLSTMAIVAPDSPGYISMAESIAENGVAAYFGNGFDPNLTLYPIFIHLVHLIFGDYVISGQIVSLVFGCLVFIPVVYLARAAFDRETALLTLFLLAVHPLLLRYSAEVLKDTGLFFFIISGIALAHLGMQKDRLFISLIAGVVAWSAILMRFFGVVSVPVAAAGALAMGIAAGMPKKRVLLHLGLFLMPIPLAGALFFLMFVGMDTTSILPDFASFLQRIVPPDPDAYADILLSYPECTGRMMSYVDLVTGHPYIFFFVELLSVLGSAFVDIFIVMFVLGLFVRPPADSGRASRIFLTVSALLFLAFCYFIVSSFFFISKRHIMPVMLMLIPWSGLGLRYLLIFFRNCTEMLREKHPRTGFLTRRIALLILILWTIGALIYAATPYRENRRYQRVAGEYIVEEFGTNTRILSHVADTRTVFYAGGTGQYYREIDVMERLIDEGNTYDFVLWDTKVGPKPEGFDEVLTERGFVLMKTFTGTDNDILYIYRNEVSELSPPQEDMTHPPDPERE